MADINNGRNVPPHSVNAGYEGMIDTASINNNRILRKAIFGYKPEMLNSFSQKTIDRLVSGSRAIAAFQLWKKLGPLFNSVVDVSAGAGAEMAVASKFISDVTAYDSDPSCVSMSRESPLLFNVSENTPYGKRDIVVLDPYWGHRYEKESRILCLNEVSWFCDVLRRANPYDPHIVVVKVPKYVKVRWLERVLHVQFTNCNTGYLVIAKRKSGDLIPIIQAFENDDKVRLSIYYPDTVDILQRHNGYNFKNNHAAENMEYCYSLDHKINNITTDSSPPISAEDDEIESARVELHEQRLLDLKEGYTEVAEEITQENGNDPVAVLMTDVIKTSFGLDHVPEVVKPVIDWLCSLDLESALKAFLEYLRKWLPERFKQFSGMQDDCSIETALEDWGLPSYLIDAVKSILSGASTSVLKLVKELLIMVYGGDLVDDFPRKTKTSCFSRDRRVVRLSDSFMEGSGFWYKGVFVTAYHVTKGHPVMLNGVKVRCRGKDTLKDLCWYGGDLPAFSKAKVGMRLYISTPNFQQEGIVISTAPLQVKFNTAPIPSLSGSPLYDYSGRIYGIYSNHLPGYGAYTTIETCGVWVDTVVQALEEKPHFSVMVPCGSGKSTYLMQKLALSGYKVVCVGPRAALPGELSKISSKIRGLTCKGFAGEDKIDDAGCNLIYITHGKFVSALERNPERFNSYDLIAIDEAHDNTALTKACIQWVDCVWNVKQGKKSLLLTGSPTGNIFTPLAETLTRYPVDRRTIPFKEALTVDEMAAHIQEVTEQKDIHVVQVPSMKYANRVMTKLKADGFNMDSLLISRATVNEKGFDFFSERAKKGSCVMLATNVLNVGYTLQLDKLTLQGSLCESEADNGAISSIEVRNLNGPERAQWIGRAGRVKPGTVFIPDVKWAKVHLTSTEGRLLEAYLISLGISKTGLVGGVPCTVARARVLTKLPMTVNQGLAIVDDSGMVYVKNPDTVAYLRESKIVSMVGNYETREFTDSKGNVYRGTDSGYDPGAKGFNELEGLSQVKTGFLASGILAVVVLGMYRTLKRSCLELYDGWTCSTSFQRAPTNREPPVPLQPGIMLGNFGTSVSDDDAFFDTISTGWISDFMSYLLSLLPRIFPSHYKGVTVMTKPNEMKLGLMMAYYLSGLGLTGKFVPGENIPDFEPSDIDSGVLSESYLEKVKRVLVGLEGIQTSHLLALGLSLALGLPSLLFLAAFSWLAYGNVGTNLTWVQKMLNKFMVEHDRNIVKNSVFGNVVLKTAFGISSVVTPLLTLVLFLLSRTWSFKRNISIGGFKTSCLIDLSPSDWIRNLCEYIPWLSVGVSSKLLCNSIATSFYPFFLSLKESIVSALSSGILRVSASLVKRYGFYYSLVNGLFKTRHLLSRPSFFVRCLTKLGVYSPPMILGLTVSSVIETSIVLALSAASWFGPEFPSWTLVYPLCYLGICIFGLLRDFFYCELAFVGLLVFYIRLNVADLKTMISKGRYEDFTSRDSLVRIFNDRLYIIKERLSEFTFFNPAGDDVLDMDSNNFMEVSLNEAAVLTGFRGFDLIRKFLSRHAANMKESFGLLLRRVNQYVFILRTITGTRVTGYVANFWVDLDAGYRGFSRNQTARLVFARDRAGQTLRRFLFTVIMSQANSLTMWCAGFLLHTAFIFTSMSYSSGTIFTVIKGIAFVVSHMILDQTPERATVMLAQVLVTVPSIKAFWSLWILAVMQSMSLLHSPGFWPALCGGALLNLSHGSIVSFIAPFLLVNRLISFDTNVLMGMIYYVATGNASWLVLSSCRRDEWMSCFGCFITRPVDEVDDNSMPSLDETSLDSEVQTSHFFTSFLRVFWFRLETVFQSIKLFHARSDVGGYIVKKFSQWSKTALGSFLRSPKLLWGHRLHKKKVFWKRDLSLVSDDVRDYVISADTFIPTDFQSWVGLTMQALNALTSRLGSFLSPLVVGLLASVPVDRTPYKLLYTVLTFQIVVLLILAYILLKGKTLKFPSFKMRNEGVDPESSSQVQTDDVNRCTTTSISYTSRPDPSADEIVSSSTEVQNVPSFLSLAIEVNSQASESESSSNFDDYDGIIRTSFSRATLRQSKRDAKMVLNRSSTKVIMAAARKTKWVKLFLLSAASLCISLFIHPVAIAFTGFNLTAMIASLGVFGTRFSADQDEVFSKNLDKFARHTVFHDEEMKATSVSLKFDPIPKAPSKTCLVVGAAGSKLWLEKAIGFYLNCRGKIPNLSCLIICDPKLFEVARKLPLPSCIVLYKVNISDPSEMRSARMIPMFIGDPETYYLHRDADWSMTPLEIQAMKLRTNLTCNPLGASPTPVLMASVNYFGSAFRDHYDYWLSTKAYWKTYGHDERVAMKFKVDHVYNRVTPLEEQLHFMSSVACDVEKSRMIVPRIFLHNNKNDTEVTQWRAVEVESYGDLRWRSALHRVSSSPRTFCGRNGVDIIRTSWNLISHLFLVCTLAASFVAHWLEPIFFSVGKNDYFASRVMTSFNPLYFVRNVKLAINSYLFWTTKSFYEDTLFTVGVFIGLMSTIPLAIKQIGRAKVLLTEDQSFREEYLAWNASRAARGVRDLLKVDVKKIYSLQYIQWFAFLASPVGFLFSKLALMTMPFLRPIDVYLGHAFLFSGKSLSFLPTIFFLLSSLNMPYFFEAGMIAGNVACIRTGMVKYWSHYPSPGVKAVLDLPYMGESDSVVMKHVIFCDPIDPFVCGVRRKRRLRVELPQGMINSRTATAIFLSRKSFINFRDYQNTCVFGSGIGGFAQGMLHEGLKGSLHLLTLEEPGFETSNAVRSDCCDIRTVVGDGLMHSGIYDLVICDVSRSALEEIWWLDDFSHEIEQAEYEEKCLHKSVHLTKKGGDLICSAGVLHDRMLTTVIDYLSMHFKEVTVVDEPIKADLGHHFFIARSKLGRRHPNLVNVLPNNFTFMTEFNHKKYDDFAYEVGVNVGMLDPECGWNSYFTPELFRIFKFGIERTLEPPSLENNLSLMPLSQDSYLFLTETPVQYVNSFQDELKSKRILEPNPHDSTEAYRVVGRTDPTPVSDREFNAGVDVISQMALAQAGVLPLDKMFDVPSQSNFAVRAGLKKRYDFKEVLPNVTIIDSVVDAFVRYYRAVFGTFDFTPPEREVFLDHLTRNSSNGYMYRGKAKTVADLVKNHWDEVRTVLHKIEFGGHLNMTFHSSPKVEKKEISSLLEESIPRLFLYRCGDVRTAKVYLSYQLNQLMKDRTYWHSACCGDMFKKAEIICSAYEKYENPAGCVFEASKWDGHVCGELYVKERMLLVELLRGNDTAKRLSTMLHSMAKYDIYGSVYMCSGDLVVFDRANKKSGEDDTSYGNKIKNDMIACHLISHALNIQPFDTFRRVTQITEGDDKEIIGELADIERIAEFRNEIYDSYGMPQKGPSAVIRRPEDSTFCSHGSTRLSNGIAVPIRDLHEVLGRHIVPLANGQFNIDFGMASRSLTSVISMVAVYWYLPHVRNFYYVIREVIPKDVIPAAVSREQRWKFYHMIGIDNPTKFELEDYLVERFGYTPYDGKVNEYARGVLNLDDFNGLLYLKAPYLIEKVRSLMHESGDIFDVAVWYEEMVDYDIIVRDVKYWDNKGFSTQLLAEKPHQLRESYLNGLTPHTGVQFGSFTSILGRVKAPVLHLIFSDQVGSHLSWAMNTLTASRAKNSGFKGRKIVFSTLGCEGEFNQLKSISTGFFSFMRTLIVTLGCGYFIMTNNILGLVALLTMVYVTPQSLNRSFVQTNKYTIRGLTVRSDLATVVSFTGPIRNKILTIKHEPSAPLVLGPARVAAYLNVGGKELKYSLKKRTAIDTLNLLQKTARRFGVLIFDDNGDLHPYLYYNQEADARITSAAVSKKRNEIAQLLGVESSKLLPVKEWKCNGSMLTVTDWHGEYSYGQLERPLSKMMSLEGRITSTVMFIRISDCPMLRWDHTDSNKYVFATAPRLSIIPFFGLVFGESTSDDNVDICKPYDADLLQDATQLEVVSFNNKAPLAIFRGGSTGAGADEESNVRHMIVYKAKDIEMLSGYRCDFKFTSVRKRLSVTLKGDLNYVKDHAVAAKLSYGEMGSAAVIVCPEGNEAPDRVLNCMATGSVVLLIDSTFCLGKYGWMERMCIDGYNVLRCEASVERISEKLKWAKDHHTELERIGSRGQALARTYLKDETQMEYLESVVNLISNANTGFSSSVKDVVSWFIKPRGQHSVMFVDREHSYAHGSGLNMDSSLFVYERIKGQSLSGGVSLYELDEVACLEFANTRNIVDSFQASESSLLLECEMVKLTKYVGSRRTAERIAPTLGKLGAGNDFVELVGNKGRTYLLVHSGGGNYSSVVMEFENDTDRVPLSRAKEIISTGVLVGQLNRDVLGRMFGAGRRISDFPHNFYIDSHDSVKYGMPKANWLISKMTLPNDGQVLMLGGPGHGAALLTADNCPNPHGTGGKGGRFRLIKGVTVARAFVTLDRYARRMMVAQPTGVLQGRVMGEDRADRA